MMSVAGRMRSRPAVEHGLTAVHTVVGVAAVAAGMGLVRNGLGLSEELLLSTPFDNWFLPGVLIALGIGGSQVLAAALLAAHDPQARAASMAAGVVLACWTVLQSLLLHRVEPLELALFVVGLTTAAVAKRLPRLAEG